MEILIKSLLILILITLSSCAFLHTNIKAPEVTEKVVTISDSSVSFRLIQISEAVSGTGEFYNVVFIREKDCSVCKYILEKHNFKSLEYINPKLASKKNGEFLHNKFEGLAYVDSDADYHVDIYTESSSDLAAVFSILLSTYTLGIIPTYAETEQVFDIKVYSKKTGKMSTSQFEADYSTWGSPFLWFSSNSRFAGKKPTPKDEKEGAYILYLINKKINEVL